MSEENKATTIKLPVRVESFQGFAHGFVVDAENGLVASCSNVDDAALIVRAVNGLGEVEAMRKALEEAEWVINATVTMKYGEEHAANPLPGSVLALIRAALSRKTGGETP